jgi:gliding motility-associated-like protein
MKFSKILFILGFAFCSNSYAQSIPVVEIDSVSVQDNQKVQVSWKTSSDARVDGYYIYRVYNNNLGEPDFYDPILVNDRNTSNYIYQDNTGTIDQPSTNVMRFYIQAVDLDVTPPNKSDLDSVASKPHQTILLKNTIDLCNASSNLVWNTYTNSNNGWAIGTAKYEVSESQNSGAYRVIYSGPNTSYVRPDLQTGVDYKFKVRVLSTDLTKSSSSNVKIVSGSFNNYPAYVYLSNATVNPDNRKIALAWTTDTTEMRLTYQIMMSTDSINFKEIARMDSVPYKRFRDTVIANLVPDRLDYFFKIITSCSCPDTLDTTAVTHVMRLKAQYIDPTTNYLTWNAYDGWLQDVGYYELYRIKLDPINLTQNSELIATLVPPDISYTDSDPNLIGSDNSVSYYIQAHEQVGNPIVPITPLSESNRAYIYTETKLVVPDVFTPNGLNPIFRPQLLTSSASKYNMKIYNRWGKLVFETDDEFQGWDGRDKDNGLICPPGSYIYLINTLDSTNKNLKKVGSVALLD